MKEHDHSKHTFTAELNYLPTVNLSLHLNGFPVARELRLSNQTDLLLEKIECRFSSQEGIIQASTVSVEQLKPGEILPVHDLKITLDYQKLSELSEAQKGALTLDITATGNALFHQDFELTAYAANQWIGSDRFPELLAAFVTPNLEVIPQILASVASELEKNTGSSAIDGYSADRKRVYEICKAIYFVIRNCGINYCNPASSFGQPGQRVRFADEICKNRIGTCLDTTLFFASVMEACGLHPVLMIEKSHAYIGCHLADKYFPDIPADDLQSIRKLSDLDEFIVIETTLATGSSTFAAAEETARGKHLKNEKEFQYAVDIVRARLSGIQPLPIRRSIDGFEFDIPEKTVEAVNEGPSRDIHQRIIADSDEKKDKTSGRIARWSQKLLDLSLRNRLLNVRDTKQMIPLTCPDIGAFEDKLAANETVAVKSLDELLGAKDLHSIAEMGNNELPAKMKTLLLKELQQHRLWTRLSAAETNKRLTTLYRQGKTDIEEGGVNTVFVALGFLEWQEAPGDEKKYLAPLLLVPVRLQRKSMADGIRISRVDEDTVINETLLELLRSQFRLTIPGLSPLPTDQSGVDVGKLIQIFRESIQSMPGWEIHEEARLGLFSFGKFIMWNDLTARADDLKKNPMVNHLAEGGGLFDDGIEVFPPNEIAQHLDLKNLFCPKSADSSQLTAVLYSALGKNYVLHGPPGTGKSQTITNIIAHNLALGKRVLFVSEKKVALEVVHKRLTEVGLRPFCLELHSNKSGKSDVLAQFSEALNVPKIKQPEDWEKNIADIETLRQELDEYVTVLHKPYPNGLSAYDCFSHLMNKPETREDLLDFDCLIQTRDEYDELFRQAALLAEALQTATPEIVNTLSWLKPTEWSPVYERKLIAAAQSFANRISVLKDSFSAFGSSFDLPGTMQTELILRAADAVNNLKDIPDVPETMFDGAFPDNLDFVNSFSAASNRLAELNERLKSFNFTVIRSLDIDGIAERLQENMESFFLFRFIKNHFLLKELSGLKKTGSKKLTAGELRDAIPLFREWLQKSQQCEKQKVKAAALLGPLLHEDIIDREKLGAITAKLTPLLTVFQEITRPDRDSYGKALSILCGMLPDGSKNFSENSRTFKIAEELFSAKDGYLKAKDAFLPYTSSFPYLTDISVLEKQLLFLVENSERIRGLMHYLEIRNSLANGNLGAWIRALESGTIQVENSRSVLITAYLQKMLDQLLPQQRVLSHFSGLTRREQIKKFSELDAKYTALVQQQIFARLAAKLPRRRTGPCPAESELGILKHECEKKTRQKAVRHLLAEIPNLAPVLKPCFLMSPLSVAQYLPTDTAPFDLIVFDEASQIPVWDAIGVIARGKQLIVVGDPKQMPPTNFFQKGDSAASEEISSEIEDLESILDECLAAGVYSCYLNWHYRSKHESLISFSNHYYYEDRLFIFPSASQSPRLGVKFQFVSNGVYDRKNSRTNAVEAAALVQYVFEKLESAEGKKRSIGIVTFSEAQQALIEDLMEKERAKHPALEPYFSDQNEEPLFVKNLENVQGDERDVILFSICYAPDKDRKFSTDIP